jgi:hypothetical protein
MIKILELLKMILTIPKTNELAAVMQSAFLHLPESRIQHPESKTKKQMLFKILSKK